MKRLISLLLAILMITSSVPVMATETVGTEPTLVVTYAGESVVKTGDTVEVTFAIKNNPGAVAIGTKLIYDTTVFKLENKNIKNDPEQLFDSLSKGTTESPKQLNWTAMSGENVTGDITIGKATFTVLDTAPAGNTEIRFEYDTTTNSYNEDRELVTWSDATPVVVGIDGDLDVTIPVNFTGYNSVGYGEDYTFYAPDKNYTHTFNATMDGEDVAVTDNGNGTYTVANVTGELVIDLDTTAGRLQAISYKYAGAAMPWNDEVLSAGDKDDFVSQPATVKYGENLELEVVEAFKSRYSYEIKYGETVITPDGNGVYSAQITGPTTVTITRKGLKQDLTITGTVNGEPYDPEGNDILTYAKDPYYSEEYEIGIAKQSDYDVTVKFEMPGMESFTKTADQTTSWSYSIGTVRGPITVTVTKVGKTKTISYTGDGADDLKAKPETAPYGTNLELELKETANYTYVVKVGETVITPVNGKYTIPVNGNITVDVDRTGKPQAVTVNGTRNGNPMTTVDDIVLSGDPVYGDYYTFTIIKPENYDITKIEMDLGELIYTLYKVDMSYDENGKLEYTTKYPVSGDVEITVTETGERQSVRITGNDIGEFDPGYMPAYGTSYSFTLTPAANYDYEITSATMGGTDITSQLIKTEENGVITYTIAEVTGEIVINTSKTPAQYSVNFAQNWFTGAEKATYKTDYTFTANDVANYENYVVKYSVNDKEETVLTVGEDGVTYTIPGENITGNITVTATRAGKPQTVTFGGNAKDAVTVTSNNLTEGKVPYGETLKFTVATDANYDYKVSIGDTELNMHEGEYQVYINGSKTITVEKTGKVQNVTVSGTRNGKDYDPDSAAIGEVVLPAAPKYGEEYTFTFTPDANYDWEMEVIVNGESVKPTQGGDGTFTVTANGAIEIIVTETGKPFGRAVAGYGADDVNAHQYGYYGMPYSFTLTKQEHFTYDVKVTMVGTEGDVTPTPVENADGSLTYTIASVTGTITIYPNRKGDMVPVTFDGTAAEAVTGTNLNAEGKIEYFTALTFSLNKDSNYTYEVKVGDTEIFPDEGIYEVAVNTVPFTVTVNKIGVPRTVTFTGEEVVTEKNPGNGIVEHGKNITFKLGGTDPNYDYTVEVGDTEITPDKDGLYTYTVEGDITINITKKGKLQDITVTGTVNGKEYNPIDVKDIELEQPKVPYGEPMKLYIKKHAHYNIDKVEIYNNGVLEETFTNVTADTSYIVENAWGKIKIVVTKTAETYDVTFTGDAYVADEFDAPAKATYGESYTFTRRDPRYSYTFGKVTYTEGDAEYGNVTDNGDGTFTVESGFDAGFTITVTAKKGAEYDVAVSGSGSSHVDAYAAKAEYGKDYTLTVKAEDYNKIYKQTVTAKVVTGEERNPVTVTDNEDGTFTVKGSAITGKLEFVVTATPIDFTATAAGNGKDDVTAPETGNVETAFVITVDEDKAKVYTYEVASTTGEVTKSADGKTFTIVAGQIKGAFTYTVTRTPIDFTATKAGNGANDVTAPAIGNVDTEYVITVDTEQAKVYTYKVTSEDVTVTDNGNGTFTVAAGQVKGNFTYTVTRTPIEFTPTFEGNGKDDVTAPETGNVETAFVITVDEDKAKLYTYEVTSTTGEVTKSADGKTFTIAAGQIKGDFTLTVERTAIPFDIDAAGERAADASIAADATGTYGTDFEFTVDTETDTNKYYDYKVTYQVAGGSKVTLTENADGKYVIPGSEIKGNITVEVTRTAKTFNIILEGNAKDEIDIGYAKEVTYGLDFRFAVAKASAESHDYFITVKIGENTLTDLPVGETEDFIYGGELITGDVTIILNKTIKEFTLTVDGAEKDAVTVTGKTETAEDKYTVTWGETVLFTVTEEANKVYTVKVDGTEVYSDAEGNYSAKEIKANTVVTVTAAELEDNEVKVVVDGEDVKIGETEMGGSGQPKATTAAKGEEFSFTLEPEDGYEYTVTVLVDGTEVEVTSSDNTYTVAAENVTGNIEIQVEKTEKSGFGGTGTGSGNRDRIYGIEVDGYEFTVKAPVRKFKNVYVDGKRLDKDDYRVKEVNGKTVIVLKDSYVEDLEKGTYSIRVTFTDGRASATFTVEGGKLEVETNPNTGAVMSLGSAAAAAAIMGAAAYVLEGKRK